MTPVRQFPPALPPAQSSSQPAHDTVRAMGIWYLGIRYEVSPRTEEALLRVLDQVSQLRRSA